MLTNFALFEATYYDVARTTACSFEQAVEAIKKNCTRFTIDSPVYYRGRQAFDVVPSCAISTPTAARRTGLDGGTAYNTLMNGLPSWQAFPKRHDSIIFTTSRQNCKKFGENVYYVIPFDGARIGVLGVGDAWGMRFKTGYEECDEILFESLDSVLRGVGVDISSYASILSTTARVTPNEGQFESLKGKAMRHVIEQSKAAGETSLQMWERLCGAEVQHASVKKYNGKFLFSEDMRYKEPMAESAFSLRYGANGDVFPGQEMYTDSKCVLVPVNMHEQLKDALS